MSEPDLHKANGAMNGTTPRPIVEEVEDVSRPNSVYYDDPPEEEIIDVHSDTQGSPSPRPTPRTSDEGRRSPAYVAPIPKIGKIPPVSRPSGVSASGRPHFPRFVTSSLVGKKIDEYGDVVDEDGTVLGRVAGDLPSMVGRSVLNQRGDVLGDDGELLGYVAEVESEKEKERAQAEQEATQSLDEYMAQSKSAFRLDGLGRILDAEGNVVGSFHDFNKMGPKPARPEKPKPKPAADDAEEKEKKPPVEGPARFNAQSHRKENESPSDIFLDVKSTTEGIQLTIRIPTVFPGGGQPRVQFS